jgi:acyl-CoA thioesterase-1
MLKAGVTIALVSAIAISSTPRAAAARGRIVVLGDSLTSGRGIGRSQAFPAILQQRLDAAGLEYAVVNAGVSGYTSTRALQRFERTLQSGRSGDAGGGSLGTDGDADIRILIVELGVNDGLRGVPVSQVKANLGRIIEIAQAHGATVLLCAMEALPIYGWDYTVAFHNAYRELAERYNVTLVPFVLTNVIGDARLMQPDRVHPNAEGARAIADAIWPYLQRLVQ